MPKAGSKTRSWWWDHYQDHPIFKSGGGGQGLAVGYAGAVSSGKHKIYCKKCLDSHVHVILQQDKDSVALGHRELERNLEQIESYCMFQSDHLAAHLMPI